MERYVVKKVDGGYGVYDTKKLSYVKIDTKKEPEASVAYIARHAANLNKLYKLKEQ